MLAKMLSKYFVLILCLWDYALHLSSLVTQFFFGPHVLLPMNDMGTLYIEYHSIFLSLNDKNIEQ